jgi:hypothetical protein
MTLLRCERVAVGDLDRAIANLGEVTLARMPEGVFIEIADEHADDAVRTLAFAGVRARPALVTLAPRPGTYAALGRDLAPLPLASLSLDLVHVRRLSVARESARLLRHPPWRRAANADRRARCRDLLRGTDAALTWRRRAWSSREILRSREARRALRPVVFDVGAVGAPPEHRLLVTEAALARWLFA